MASSGQSRRPGRASSTRRPGSTTRPGARNTRPGQPADRGDREVAPPARRPGPGAPQVWKLAGVALVVVLLSVFLFPTVSGYLQQRQEISALEQDIETRQQEITALEGQVARWDDPDFVEHQARERLRFVRPGETAFTVLDDTGEQLTEAVPGMAPVTADIHELRPWYGEVWESVKVANEALPEIESRDRR
jgi:cell division protein FtsB